MFTSSQIGALIMVTEIIIYFIVKIICNTIKTNHMNDAIAEMGYRMSSDDFKQFINTLCNPDNTEFKKEE